MLLALSPAPAAAQFYANTTIPASAFSHNMLDASIQGPTNLTFSDFRENRTLPILVNNPTDSRMDVYVALYQNDHWYVVDKLGSVEPGEQKNFSYNISFKYGGKTTETDKFGVAGRVSSGYLGTTFGINENWSKYEDSLKSSLSFFGVISAAVLLGILIIILSGVLAMAMRTKHRGEEEEYTLKTLFFPVTRMRPWAERIADIIINPFFWLFEMLLGSILIAIILFVSIQDTRPDIGILIFAVGGVAAIFMPVVFLVIGWLADYYEREPFRFIVGMFMWGIMATFFAFFINTTISLVLGIIVGTSLAEVLIAIFIAPVVEETAKGLGLLILSGHHEFDGAFDGILYGFAIGMGFAFIENWLYFAVNASPIAVGGLADWTYNILYRSFLCSLAHGCFTATTGFVIGIMKEKRKTTGFEGLGFFLGLPLAILLHGTFNLTAVVDQIMQTVFGVPVPIFDPLLTIVVTVIYICIGIYLQLKIKNKLQSESNGRS